MEDVLQKGSEAAQAGMDAAEAGVNAAGFSSTTALIVDILVVCFLLLFAFIGGKKGLYNTFMPLVVVVLAIFVGIAGSRALTPVVHAYLYPNVEKQVVEKFDTSVQNTIEGISSPSRQFQKQWNNLLESVGINTKPIADQVTEPEAVSVARQALIEKTSKSFDLFASWVLFGICAAIGMLLLTILKNFVGEIADWPVIRWFDFLGGFAIGAIIGFITLFITVKICGIVGVDFFQGYAEGTKILSLFTDTY